MFKLPTPKELQDFQIEHYTKRLKEETKTAAKRYLRAKLYHIKQAVKLYNNASN